MWSPEGPSKVPTTRLRALPLLGLMVLHGPGPYAPGSLPHRGGQQGLWMWDDVGLIRVRVLEVYVSGPPPPPPPCQFLMRVLFGFCFASLWKVEAEAMHLWRKMLNTICLVAVRGGRFGPFGVSSSKLVFVLRFVPNLGKALLLRQLRPRLGFGHMLALIDCRMPGQARNRLLLKSKVVGSSTVSSFEGPWLGAETTHDEGRPRPRILAESIHCFQAGKASQSVTSRN